MERTEEMNRVPGGTRAVEGHYVDWPSIFGGAVVAVAVGTVFTGFGAALGLSTISPGEGGFNLMVIVSAVWIMLTLVASYMTGGYIAGRMRRRIDSASSEEITARDGVNGLVVWGLGIIVSVMLLGSAVSTTLSTAGSIASTAGNVAGDVVSAAGTAVGGAAEGALSAAGAMVPDAAKEDPLAFVTSTLLRPAQVAAPGAGAADGTTGATATGGAASTADVATEVAAILGNVLATGEISDAERSYLESAVAATTGVTGPDAAAKVETAVTAAQSVSAEVAKATADAEAAALKLEEDAKALAVAAAELARVSTILTAFLLAAGALVAGAASYVGAVHGGRHRDEARIFRGFAYRG